MHTCRLTGMATLATALWFVGASHADEAAEILAKQKASSAAKWEKFASKDASKLETDLFLLHGTVPEAKLKAIGEAMTKHYTVAVKALKFEKDQKPWTGKLAVFILTDRENYTQFVRQAEQRSPQAEDSGSVELGGDLPFITIGMARGQDAMNPEQAACSQVSVAVLRGKAGKPAALAGWFTDGFAWTVASKANPQSVAKDRQRMKALVSVPTRVTKHVWDGTTSGKDQELLGASLVQYLVYGPDSAKLQKLFDGLRRNENGEINYEVAFEGAQLQLWTLDKTWRAWAMKN